MSCRHRPIWDDLTAELKSRGVHNYSIFLHPATRQLFGYVEIEDEARWAAIAQTDACRRWWKFMGDLMPSNPDNSPVSRNYARYSIWITIRAFLIAVERDVAPRWASLLRRRESAIGKVGSLARTLDSRLRGNDGEGVHVARVIECFALSKMKCFSSQAPLRSERLTWLPVFRAFHRANFPRSSRPWRRFRPTP